MEEVKQHTLKKFFKNFTHGLNRLLIGIRIMFDPDIVGNTSITREQLVNFILNKEEGLGRKYEFNTIGKNSFVSSIYNLNNKELIAAEKMLSNPRIKVSRFGGGRKIEWKSLGES